MEPFLYLQVMYTSHEYKTYLQKSTRHQCTPNFYKTSTFLVSKSRAPHALSNLYSSTVATILTSNCTDSFCLFLNFIQMKSYSMRYFVSGFFSKPNVCKIYTCSKV